MEQTLSRSDASQIAGDPAATGLRAIFETLRRLVARARRAAAHRASLRALARLEPHHLADIGLTRYDVRRELRRAGLAR